MKSHLKMMMSLHYPTGGSTDPGTLLLGCVKGLERKGILMFLDGGRDTVLADVNCLTKQDLQALTDHLSS